MFPMAASNNDPEQPQACFLTDKALRRRILSSVELGEGQSFMACRESYQMVLSAVEVMVSVRCSSNELAIEI